MRIQVSNEGGAGEPRWKPDGRTLVYRTGRRFLSAELSFTTSIEVIRRDTVFLNTFFGGTSSGRNHDIRPPTSSSSSRAETGRATGSMS